MKFKQIHFILNPVAGSKEPILSHINQVFCDSDIKWDVSVTQKDGDANRIAKSLIGKTDLIVVYGGDGSLMEVACAIFHTETPMAIIPGGTANVTAKELGIPVDTIKALELIKTEQHKIINMDMGMVNKTPFLIRVNLGIMADMISDADRKLKDSLGQLAYGVTAVKSLVSAEPINFNMVIDGEKINEKGVMLTVTNSGSLGVGSFAMLPGITVTDGLLDVILLNDKNFFSVMKVAGSTLMQHDSEVLKHWKCKEITIQLDEELNYICDDAEKKAKTLQIKVVPGALKMLVPENN